MQVSTGTDRALRAVVAALVATWTLCAVSHAQSVSDSSARNETRPPSLTFLRPSATVHRIHRGVELHVPDEAQFEAGLTTSLPLGPKGAQVLVQSVAVREGRVDVVMPSPSAPRGVLLQGPRKVSGIVTSGRLSMIVSDEDVIVAALEGNAVVGQEGGFMPLLEGHLRVYPRSGRSVQKALPSSPTLITRDGLQAVLSGRATARITSDSKAPLRIVVLDDRGVTVAAAESKEAKGVEFTLPQAGTYFAYARELGVGGLEGSVSEALKLQFLGLAPGQKGPERGVFLLNPGERVTLVGIEGLEMRYGKSKDYVPATSSLGLSSDEPVRVAFRDPDRPARAVVLRFAPRVQDAQIHFDSPRAVWPGSAVGVRVALKSGLGDLIPLSDKMQIVTHVNMTRITPRWTMTKRGLVTKVPSQKGEGPWVIRVEVKDKNGRTIVRNHLEIVSR